MYLPYFRAKRFELLMLRSFSQQITRCSKIIPIIEPINSNFKDIKKACVSFVDNEMPFILIINPQVGKLINKSSEIMNNLILEELLNYSNLQVGLIIHPHIKIKMIESFIEDFKNYRKVFIHNYNHPNLNDFLKIIETEPKIDMHIFNNAKTNTSYQDKFSKFPRVLLIDNFIHRKNKDYPFVEFFSDLHNKFIDLNFQGFGDFTIVGDNFSNGGPAYAVTIHLTHKDKDENIIIFHFISDTTDNPKDPAGKFFEALKKLHAYILKNKNSLNYSTACEEYEDLFRRQHFPGLGALKKISMKQHLELIINLICE